MARCATCHRRLLASGSCATHGAAGAARRPEQGPIAPPAWREPLGDCLGVGGFASVWAIAPAHRPAAVLRGPAEPDLADADRVLKISHTAHDLARARVAREAEALTAIGTPHVPALIEQGIASDGRAWLVMQRVHGVTLGEAIARGALAVAEALALADEMLAALAGVHAAGFVHRDVKPDNAVDTAIDAGGRVVLLDLGLARKLPTDPGDPTRPGVQVGSLEYIAPEQLADASSVDARADLYAFGCVLFELLAGRPPFVGDAAALERAHTALRPPRIGAFASVSMSVEVLVDDCLAKDRARRPATADDTRARLREARTAYDAPTRRGEVSRSVIREGRQPVVLLWAELAKVDRVQLAELAARKLVIASQRGRRVLAAALGGDHQDPASVAIAAARELAAGGARVALHLEALRVEHTGGAPVLRGDAIENPDTWLPSATWRGVIVTDAFASIVRVPTRAIGLAPPDRAAPPQGGAESRSSDVGPGFRTLAAADDAPELVGRAGLLADLTADAAAALHGARPTFALLVGDAGVGKTAVAHELAQRLRELPEARVVLATVPPPGAGRASHAALAELLPAAVPDDGRVRVVGDALRAAARERPLAVILDDLHVADHELYDTLEYATLGGEPVPLWVLGVASPRVDVRRPQLGARAERHRRDVLAVLDNDDALTLAATLLQPAEYPPLRALRKLVDIAGGNPLHLATLARELHARGAIRERPGGAPFLDATAIDELQPAALGPWLATRELGALSNELSGLARLCAIVGDELDRDELVAIVDAVERSGGATTSVDVEVGLGELARAGMLAATPAGYRFAHALVEEGVYATTDDEHRRRVHEAALAYWQARSGDAADAHVARHASAIGDRAAAAAAYAQLADQAERAHHTFDAELGWQHALEQLEPSDARRADALFGRARARYKLQRVRDALADLDAALVIARGRGDGALEVRAMVEQAIALDWAEEFDRSAAVAREARARWQTLAVPVASLEVDLDLADGRSRFRAFDFAAAAEQLRPVVARARAQRRPDVQTIAGLLLGPSLVDTGALDEAEQVFADLIDTCNAHGDRFHLAGAYANRAWLWSARGEIERSARDLRAVIQIAREVGQALTERVGTHNLAEGRLWEGALDEALQLARRALAIQQAHAEGTTVPDRVLVARILAARGDRDELAGVLETLARDPLPDDDARIVAVLRASVDDDPNAWHAALDGLEQLVPVQLPIELAHLALRHGQLGADDRARYAELARKDPIWSRRANEL